MSFQFNRSQQFKNQKMNLPPIHLFNNTPQVSIKAYPTPNELSISPLNNSFNFQEFYCLNENNASNNSQISYLTFNENNSIELINERRRRNADASARFRERKKIREQNMIERNKFLEERVKELEKKLKEIREENNGEFNNDSTSINKLDINFIK
jgi:hypothetical protein